MKFRFVYKGGPGSGFAGHAGRPGEIGGSQPGFVSRFDINTYWKDQDKVTLYHGTTLDKLEQIRKSGFVPSEIGHTSGKVYFTTSPTQADMYAAEGGEVEHGGYAVVKPKDRVIIEVRIPPKYLTLSGLTNFKTKEAWETIKDEIKDTFGDRLNDLMLEFFATENIPSDFISHVYRSPIIEKQ